MAVNLVQNFSFEGGLLPWQTGGPVVSSVDADAFEGDSVAAMGPLVAIPPLTPAPNAILSQAFPVDANAVNLRLSYAVRALVGVEGLLNGQFQTRIRWQRGEADGYSVISEETLETIEAGALTPLQWENHVITSGLKPADAVQARLRFVLLGGGLITIGGVAVDQVVITAED
ncbi:hypothetical protein [Paenibacillus humicola]|uniref:hypothetical protein n=1 Tax=Paenibacillus humicola TaxID=3110540 RepID=UPI00237A9797|nr:hypothetical protein [Paenibacillus humicola]